LQNLVGIKKKNNTARFPARFAKPCRYKKKKTTARFPARYAKPCRYIKKHYKV
jgi:NAD(P)H-dependent flavin oxidoreductase YrpB (nitropropane dioxygenase family)